MERQSDFEKMEPCWWIPQFVPIYTRVLFTARVSSLRKDALSLLSNTNAIQTGKLGKLDAQEQYSRYKAVNVFTNLAEYSDSMWIKLAGWLSQINPSLLPDSLDGIVSMTLQVLRQKHGNAIDFICSCVMESEEGLSMANLIDLLSCSNELVSKANELQTKVILKFPSLVFRTISHDLVQSGILILSSESDGMEYYQIEPILATFVSCKTQHPNKLLADYFCGELATKYPSRDIAKNISDSEHVGKQTVRQAMRSLRQSANWERHGELFCNLNALAILCDSSDGISVFNHEYDNRGCTSGDWNDRMTEQKLFISSYTDFLQSNPQDIFPIAYNTWKDSLPSRAAAFLASKNQDFWKQDNTSIPSKRWLRLMNRPCSKPTIDRNLINKSTHGVTSTFPTLSHACFSTDGKYGLLIGLDTSRLVDLSMKSIVWEYPIVGVSAVFHPGNPTIKLVTKSEIYSLDCLLGTFEAGQQFACPEEVSTCMDVYKKSNVYDEMTAIGFSNGIVTLLNRFNVRICNISAHSNAVSAVSWNSDGLLATGSGSGLVRIWKFTPYLTNKYSITIGGGINDISWMPLYNTERSPNLKLCESMLAIASDDGKVSVWALGDTFPMMCSNLASSSRFSICKICWNWDGERIAAADASGTITMWNWKTNTCLETIQAHKRPIVGMFWNSYEANCCSAASDGSLALSDINNEEIPAREGECILEDIPSVLKVVTCCKGALRCISDDHTAYESDLENDTLRKLSEPPFAVSDAEKATTGCMSPGGMKSFALVEDKLIVWNVDDSTVDCTFSLDGMRASFMNSSTSWHPSLKWCVTTTPGSLLECAFFWSTCKHENLKFSFLSLNTNSLHILGSEFSPCGTKLLLFTSKAVLMYECGNTDPFNHPPKVMRQISGSWSIGAWSPESKMILLIESYVHNVHCDLNKLVGSAEIHTISETKELTRLKEASHGNNNTRHPSFYNASDCQFSRDGKFVAILFGNSQYQSWYSNPTDGCCVLYDSIDGTIIATFSPPSDVRLHTLFSQNDVLKSWDLALVEEYGHRTFFLSLDKWCFRKIDVQQMERKQAKINTEFDLETSLFIKEMLESQWSKLDNNVRIPRFGPSEISIEGHKADKNMLVKRETELKGLTTLFADERKQYINQIQSANTLHDKDVQMIDQLTKKEAKNIKEIDTLCGDKTKLTGEVDDMRKINQDLEKKIAEQTEQLSKCRCIIQ